MVDGPVTGEPLTGFPVDPALVSAQVRRNIDFGFKNGPQVCCIHFRDVSRAHPTFALNERDHGFLGRGGFVRAVPRPATNKGFVRLDEHAVPAERAARTVVAHSFPNAMTDKPSGFEINTEDPSELICAEALLRRAHQVHCLKPNMQRHMARLEDGSDFDGERLTARIAFVNADAGAFAFQRPGTIDYATFRADTSIRPKLRFDVGISGGFATETGFI